MKTLTAVAAATGVLFGLVGFTAEPGPVRHVAARVAPLAHSSAAAPALTWHAPHAPDLPPAMAPHGT